MFSQAFMDSLAFRVVRPVNQLTEVTLLKHFGKRSEQFTQFNAKLIQRYALLNHVSHKAMLTLLIEKARQPLDLPSFGGLSQVLRAVQRFPSNFNAEKREFETAFLNSVLAVPVSSLSSAECGALWPLAAHVTEWEDVLALSDTFQMRSTLQHQSKSEYRALLDHIVAATPPTPEPAPGADGSDIPCDGGRSARLLTDLIGVEYAVERLLDDITQSGAHWPDREAAVRTLVGVAHTLRRWPSGRIADGESWKNLVLRVSTLHISDMTQLFRLLIRVHSPVVPSYARESLHDAFCADLWNLYMEYSTEPVAVFFESGELCPEKALRFCGEEASGVGQVEGPPVHPREALRQLHKATLEKQLASDGPPLTLSALINLFVSSAFLDVGDDLMVAILSALNSTLLNLSPRSASSSSSAGPRCVTPLEASSVAVALARVESIVTQLGKTSTAASRMKEEMGSVERALLPVLQPDALLARGSARCVMRLLCDCPSWTRRCGLEEGCLRALRDHAGDGFTRANLERLLRHNASNLLLLPADVKESVERCLVELPIR